MRRTATVTRPTLGAVGCPGCGGQCLSADFLVGYAAGQQARGSQLGALGPIDFADWRTWAIGGLLVVVLYQLFFSAEKRERRQLRTDKLRRARDRYLTEVRRIREV